MRRSHTVAPPPSEHGPAARFAVRAQSSFMIDRLSCRRCAGSTVTSPTSESGARLFIGTSGWQYADWRGVLYPKGLPQHGWLARYAEAFNTVEVNSTFYGLPAAATAAAWAATVPQRFRFALKMSRYVTHRNDLRHPEAPIHRFMERLSGIGSRLGPIVVQLPPS